MDKKVEKQRASYRTMAESTKEDWEIIGNYAMGFNADLPNRILDHLKMLRGDHGGFAVDRFQRKGCTQDFHIGLTFVTFFVVGKFIGK